MTDRIIAADGFTEWCRSQVRGGIERRDRNDFYEAFSVYGIGADGQLGCRYYHRYPEHERDFGLTYARTLSFDDFNRRLLSELDKHALTLRDYHACIKKAESVSGNASDAAVSEGFTDSEYAALQDFCESIDTLSNKTFLHGDGAFSCDCESVVGNEPLSVRFRKPLPHDALYTDVAGVRKETAEGYDIDNLWVMSVYNRINERSASCRLIRLVSEWSIQHESILLISAEGFPGVEGALLVAIADPSQFRRFGFYSLDFANK